ncbi:hypothetical protein, partial [Pigmentiphaga soli]|uniref:beta strand repeat-containing protein n=1 Tax=Pigmentiphaga soli TaxID=1007095 RepID=UPI0031E89DC9
ATAGQQSLTIAGNADITGNVGAGATLESLAISGSTDLHAADGDTTYTVATAGNQSYGGALTYDADAAFASATGDIAFRGTVDSDGKDLTANAGGSVGFGGAVGGETRVGDVVVNAGGATVFDGTIHAASITTDPAGTLAINGGLIDTTGAQTYGEHAVLGADTTLTGSTITLAQGVDAATAGQQSLTIDGDASITGNVGAGAALESLAISGSTDLRAADGDTIYTVATAGNQSYGGALTYDADAAFTSTTGDIAFHGTVDSDGKDLTVNAAGDVGFDGAIGSTTRLGDIAINAGGATVLDGAVHAASVATDPAGTLAINGGLVDTTGAQTYGEFVILGADTVLTGSAITLAQGVDAAESGEQSLTIDGDASITGNVGVGAALESLAISGSTELHAADGGTTQTVATIGGQSYGGALTYDADAAFASADGDVAFHGTVDSDGKSLAVDAAGDVGFDGAIGSTTRVGDIAINAGGATVFDGAVHAASVATDPAGTLAINGGLIDTTGDQTYGEHAVLGADTILAGATITLAQGADATQAGEQSLTIDGNAVLAGDTGADQALASLTVTGNSTLEGSVATIGDQSYQGPATLSGDLSLTTGGGNVAFGDTLEGGHDLAVASGAGDITFAGAIGGTDRVGALDIAGAGATVFDGAVRAASVATDEGGTLSINGGSVDTTGAQAYGEFLMLTGDTVLSGTQVSLTHGIDATDAGGQGLTIDGDAVLGGDIGAGQALSALSVTGSTAFVDGGTVATTGGQAYQSAVGLAGDRALASSGGSLVFGSTIDSGDGSALSLAAAGAIGVDGAVGADGTLGALTIDAGDTVTFGDDIHADSLRQAGAGGPTTFHGAIVADGAGGIDLTGGSFVFEDAVTASLGAVGLHSVDGNATVSFSGNANVTAATGFVQTGGAAVQLPSSIAVLAGPVSIEAVASATGPTLSIFTDGNVTMTGLNAPATLVTIGAGTGGLLLGVKDADPAHKIVVAGLAIPSATSAQLYGSINGYGGPLPASMIDSTLVASPFYMNDVPWGPAEPVMRVTSATQPIIVIPSTPGALSLFTMTTSSAGVTPDALSAFAAPPVLTIAEPGTGQPERQGLDERQIHTVASARTFN